MAVLIKGMGISVVIVVGAITFYLLYKGMPFFMKHGLGEMLLRSRWNPVGENPSYGISYMIGTSIFGSFGAMIIAMPIGVATAIYMEEMAPKWFSDRLEVVIELMAGMPSIIYGLAGLMVLTPMVYDWEKLWMKEEWKYHVPSGGANLLTAILVLAMMILPTIITMSKEAIRAVPKRLRMEAMALGASGFEVSWSVVLESAKSGIISAGILSLGKVLGETMAVSLVAGGVVNAPKPFSSVRFLTTALVSEMGYATGNHREALFSIGLILYLLVMILFGGVHGLTKKKQNKK